MQREHRRYRAWPWTTYWSTVLLVGLCLGVLLQESPALAGSTVEQRPAPRGAEDSQQPTPPQERFLQHFISRSLGQEEAREARPESLQPPPTSSAQRAHTSPAEQQAAATPAPQELTTAATTMLLALGGIVAFLSAGGYLARRHFLKPATFGKRGTPIRVLGRVNLTPKAAVALLEVPGKLLVIGITSSTLTALGEVVSPALEAPDTPAEMPAVSFADTLEQQTLALPGQAKTDDTLLHVPEAIQRMVSGLKRL